MWKHQWVIPSSIMHVFVETPFRKTYCFYQTNFRPSFLLRDMPLLYWIMCRSEKQIITRYLMEVEIDLILFISVTLETTRIINIHHHAECEPLNAVRSPLICTYWLLQKLVHSFKMYDKLLTCILIFHKRSHFWLLWLILEGSTFFNICTKKYQPKMCATTVDTQVL